MLRPAPSADAPARVAEATSTAEARLAQAASAESTPTATAVPPSPTTTPAPAPTPGPVTLTAMLHGAGKSRARIGIAQISPEDRAVYEESRDEPNGPRVVSDLANVAQWIDVEPATAEGGARIGPATVPPAPVYILGAVEESSGDLFFTRFVFDEGGAVPASGAALDAGVLERRAPTGLRVRLTNAPEGYGAFDLFVSRLPNPGTAEQSSAWLSMTAWLSPAAYAAVGEGEPMPLSLDTPALAAPLPPDPAVQLVLRAPTGESSQPRVVPLSEGHIIDVDLDAAAMIPELSAPVYRLKGRLVHARSGRPVPFHPVRWECEPAALTVETDGDGRFEFEGLRASATQRLVVDLDAPRENGRPRGPQSIRFEEPPHPEHPEFVERTVEVPGYRWLLIDLPRARREALLADTRRGTRMPLIYALERLVGEGWQVVRTEEFIDEEEGVAVSIEADGIYRVAVALTPLAVSFSDLIEFGPALSQATVEVDTELPPSRRLRLIDYLEQPVAGARLTFGSPLRGLPPSRFETDAAGGAEMGPMRAGYYIGTVELPGITRPITLQVGAEEVIVKQMPGDGVWEVKQ